MEPTAASGSQASHLFPWVCAREGAASTPKINDFRPPALNNNLRRIAGAIDLEHRSFLGELAARCEMHNATAATQTEVDVKAPTRAQQPMFNSLIGNRQFLVVQTVPASSKPTGRGGVSSAPHSLPWVLGRQRAAWTQTSTIADPIFKHHICWAFAADTSLADRSTQKLLGLRFKTPGRAGVDFGSRSDRMVPWRARGFFPH